MKYLKIFITSFLLLTALHTLAQTDAVPVFKGAIKANREKTYNNIIKNSITKNLSLPLSDSTEADWEDAFSALELINYKQPWVNEKIKVAFDGIEKRSVEFQRSLLEMVYALRINSFADPVIKLLSQTDDAKIFAMCGEYLLLTKRTDPVFLELAKHRIEKILTGKDEKKQAIIQSFMTSFGNTWKKNKPFISLINLLAKNYLKGNVVVYSIQRKDRNYTGIVLVKDTSGNFITTLAGTIFSVPQLARSITNMPGYLTNGNTPQGIFRMYGFAVSKSPALGPTENLQLTMPFETTVQHFLKDSSITDTIWTEELYRKLLPKSLQSNIALYETYNASRAGRTEIIAHGTTVDPEYYKGQIYYPFTPTAGCLATKEIWSGIDGKRTISDQQKLVDAIKKAGGADGYVIVIEIDDQQKPVSINEILPYLKARQ